MYQQRSGRVLGAAVRLGAAIAGAASLGTTALAQGISDDVVRIGVLNDQSGYFSTELGNGAVIAARMAIEDFGGTVNGKKIDLIVADDQNKPDVGMAIARRWMDVEKVDAILGGSISPLAIAVSGLMRDKQKPYLISGSGTADLTGKACSPMSIQFVYDTYSLPKAAVKALSEQGKKTWFFITVDYGFGTQMQEDATRFIEAAGGKVVGAIKHPLGATDYSSHLMRAQASGADVVVFANAGPDFINAVKQAAEYGLNDGNRVLTGFGVTPNMVLGVGLEATQGMQFADPQYWNKDEPSREWSERFMKQNGGRAPTYQQAGSYSAVMHYLKAVQAAGTDEGPTVMAQMKATPINDFSMKDVHIREDGQAMRPMQLVQVKSPAESKSRYDIYNVRGTLPAESVWRPLAEGGCGFITAGK
ncbi:ABC transporter substrate-binding protein [Achromobacter sp. GG226]|uniref:ABC transporter substrate-binding protein n=1 Tax=Verticiella alkaliphila TaxID=2779529 RepID=UPI001C0D4A90|nr:ABC transporter substrate-binding protein [Verticiella sp. GG226]MBU4610417.1 ABC transporter substrate-binding protein [Verticiella sp. GG226]